MSGLEPFKLTLEKLKFIFITFIATLKLDTNFLTLIFYVLVHICTFICALNDKLLTHRKCIKLISSMQCILFFKRAISAHF